MKRVTVVALIAVAGILAIFVGAGVLARVLLSGSLKDTLVASLSQTLKVPVSVGRVDFDLGQWLRLRPSLALRQVAISNPKGFSSRRLLEADEMTAQVDFLSVFGKNVRVHSITVHLARHGPFRALRQAPSGLWAAWRPTRWLVVRVLSPPSQKLHLGHCLAGRVAKIWNLRRWLSFVDPFSRDCARVLPWSPRMRAPCSRAGSSHECRRRGQVLLSDGNWAAIS